LIVSDSMFSFIISPMFNTPPRFAAVRIT
jgi:hypothetical protein